MKNKSEQSDIKEFIPEKKEEYEAFINLLEDGIPIESWSGLAEALSVSKDTITDWKKTPRAQKALKALVKEALSGMKKAGADDWRMWDRYMKLIGVDAPEQITGKDGGPISIKLIDSFN